MSIQVSPNTVTNGSHGSVSGGDNYLLELLKQCQKSLEETLHITSLQEIRDRASSIIRQSTLPTTKIEEWRFTDLSALKQFNFQVAAPAGLPAALVTPTLMLSSGSSQVVSPMVPATPALPATTLTAARMMVSCYSSATLMRHVHVLTFSNSLQASS